LTDSGGVAIVGCGWAGHRHADAFIAEGARLRWAVDVDLERASEVAALQPGARPATNLEEPLSDPAVTMVDVCLPHYLHALRARQRFAEMEAEDTVVTVLGFEDGAVGTLVESFFMIDPTTTTGAEVHRLRSDGDNGSLEVTAPERLRVTTLEAVREVTVPFEDTFRAEVHEFLACVASRREPTTSARSQRRNLELVEAAYASIASGQPVRL
jgi:predicted dehydrogenase